MSVAKKWVFKLEQKFDRGAKRMTERFPRTALCVMCVLMPIFILGAVAALSTRCMLPIALLFGWL